MRLPGLRSRLLLLLVAVIGAMAALMVAEGQSRRQAAVMAARAHVRILTQVAEEEHRVLVEQLGHLVETVALQEVDLSAGDCAGDLVRLKAAEPWIANVFLSRPDGTTICASTGNPPAALNVSDRPYFQEALRTGRATLSDYMIGRTTRAPILAMARPILGPDGQVKAVARASMRLNWAGRLAAMAADMPNGLFAIVDAKGEVLVRFPAPAQAAPPAAPTQVDGPAAPPGDNQLGAVLTGQRLDDALVSQLFAQPTGTLLSAGLDGVPRIIGFGTLQGINARVVVSLPRAEAVGEADEDFWRSMMGLAAVAAAAFLLGIFALETSVMSRLGTLTRVVERIGRGERGVRAPERASDAEFAVLARAINTMAHNLEQGATDLAEREVRFRDLIDVSTDWYWEADPDRRLTYVSPGVRSIGLDPLRMVGQKQVGSLTPTPETAAALAGGADKQEFRDLRYVVSHPSGRRYHIVLSGRPLYDADGAIRGWRGVGRDITALVEARDALEESEARFRLLADRASDIILLTRPDGTRLYVSPSVERILGYGVAEFTRLPLSELRHPDDQAIDATLDALSAAASRAGSGAAGAVAEGDLARGVSARFRLRHKGGRWIWLETIISLTRGDDGMPLLISAARDVTERVRQEEELRAARDTLTAAAAELEQARRVAEDANAAKSAFLTATSHEIRTPLNGIIGAVQLLAAEPLAPLQRDLAVIIRDSAQTLLLLVDDLLDLSKLEAGRVDLVATDFQLAAVVTEAARLMEGQARAKGLVLSTRIAPEAAATFRGDARRLRQLLLNLLGNAVKFTDKGQVQLTAEVVEGAPAVNGGSPRDVRVVLTVRDTGIGMTADQQARLFNRFVQGDDGIAQRYGGSGLGLSICRELVTLMGGTITLDSSPGQGSTFTIDLTLPRLPGQAAATDEAAPPPAALPPGPPPPGAPPRRGAGRRVLVVEDNSINARLTEMMLRTEGYAVELAGDGAAGAAIALGQPPVDLVLMDIQMAGLDGLEATRRIRAGEPPGRRVPVIAMTANAMVGMREEYLAAGMDDYVSKPFDQGRFLDLVARWTGAPAHPGATEGPRPMAGPGDGFPMADQPLFDGEPLAKLVDLAGRDGTVDMVREFVSFGQARIARTAGLVTAGNLPEARREAHSLISTVGNLGLRRLQYLAQSLEQACIQGDAEEARQLVAAIVGVAPASWAALARDYPVPIAAA
ncbi:PAS domain S-box-containing protein [Nitrospirillum amazonense]|uniref:histidine kinase n=1 Tax=Nitrospirillum amazonense TaxID=28077 RepID=A0A560EQI6_9PROT|nr:ATP-binding protein [Nitrospirillum amazonense]TWB11597.1 PAS domain S-box-containing protein [Nitrospirillum amazonense]